MKFHTDIRGSQTMYPIDFGDRPPDFFSSATMRLAFAILCDCLDDYWMDWHEIWYTHLCPPQDEF